MAAKETRWTRYPNSIEPSQPVDASPRQDRRRSPRQEDTDQEPRDRLTPRLRAVVAFFLLASLVVIARLITWQLAGTSSGAEAGTDGLTDLGRGRIVDRNGLLMASDVFIWELYANPEKIQKDAKADELSRDVAAIINLPREELRARFAENTSLAVLAKQVPEAQCQRVMALGKPDYVWCDYLRSRAYPQGVIGAHVLGFTDYGHTGSYGVEATYDSWLRAQVPWPANRFPSPSVLGNTQPLSLPEAWRWYLPSPAGRDLVLHMSAALQYLAEKRLHEALVTHQAEAGTIVVMDPRNGAILALANYPTFDPNQRSEADLKLWANPAVSDVYEPGSVFKLITFAAALDTGRITPDSTVRDDGILKVGDRPIRNAEDRVYGEVTARYALAKSINVITARMSLDMGTDTFYRYVHRFGFGRPTEVDLPGESAGIVKEPGDKNWSPVDQATNSFGQGISVTSLQMAAAVTAIANGGRLLQPQAAKALVWDGLIYPLPTRVLGYPIKPDTARTLTQMMVYSVDTSSYARLLPGYRVAGKTGTAEIPTETGYTSRDPITSFVGFFPAADPQVLILVKLVKPRQSRWAEQVAVPVFKQVAQDAVQALKIQPNDRDP